MKYEIFFNRKKTLYHYSNHLNERKSLSIPEYVFTCVYSFTCTHLHYTPTHMYTSLLGIQIQTGLKIVCI